MKQQSKESVLVMANAITMTVGVVGQLAGGQISNTLGGSPMTQDVVNDLVASHIQNRLNREAHFLKKV